jgi:DNA polymerase-1
MLAHDPNLLRVFNEGRDPHMEMAMEITEKPESEITSEIRKQAKPVNFGFLYGMGAPKFVTYARDNYEVDYTEAEAYKVREAFFRKWPRLRAWHDRQRRIARNHLRVQSPIGRIRHLPDMQSGDKEVRAEAERQAINSPVQSFASDLMLLSALQLNDRLDPRVGFIVGSIHDALGFQCREDRVDEVVPIIRETMLNPPIKRLFGATLTVPIDVEIKSGQHWGEGKIVV